MRSAGGDQVTRLLLCLVMTALLVPGAPSSPPPPTAAEGEATEDVDQLTSVDLTQTPADPGDTDAVASSAPPQWLQDKLELQQRLEDDRVECERLAALYNASRPASHKTWCGRAWDGLLCWQPAPPNTSVNVPCPLHVPGMIPGVAERECGSTGAWVGGEGDREGWTDYEACLVAPPANHTDLTLVQEWLPTIRRLSVVGYSVSLATLLVSFVILASLRKLRCPRNLLHLHLFGSFMLRALVVLLKTALSHHALTLPLNPLPSSQLGAPDAGQEWWACKVLISVWQYFILANYSWLLMEGLYLHSLIFLALFTDSSAITLYILLGWGLPLACVGAWAGLRAALDDTYCWTVNRVQWIFWVCIRAPVALSNLLNFFFFLNVVRVLFLKLRSSVSVESMKYRRLGKSTLVLVPLFGVHYFLLWGLSTSTSVTVELVWLLLDQVFASFQGFCVAVLYCLMNGEVRQELRKLYYRWYKGDPMAAAASQSTLVSQTKTYASRCRMSLHSIHSQADPRRDRQTPSPQLSRAGGGGWEGGASLTPSPCPTPVPAASHGFRQQPREARGNNSCEDIVELHNRGGQDATTSTAHTPPSTVEILIDLHQDDGETLEARAKRATEKQLKFSESIEQFQYSKTKSVRENGSVCANDKEPLWVNVSTNSLKSSTTPVKVNSQLTRSNSTKSKEHETML